VEINAHCKTDDERASAVREMSRPIYVRVVCRTGVAGDGTAKLGSIFIVISEEPEDLASYMLRNESAHIALCYRQQLGAALYLASGATVDAQRIHNDEWVLNQGSERFVWASVLHQRLLSVSFAARAHGGSYKSPGELEKLQLMDLQPSQEAISVRKPGQPTFELLVELDKIGTREELYLRIGERRHAVQLTVETDGISRVLVLKDLEQVEEFSIVEMVD
jgi:hypothetical protein